MSVTSFHKQSSDLDYLIERTNFRDGEILEPVIWKIEMCLTPRHDCKYYVTLSL